MATARRKTTTEKGLGYRHRVAVDALKRRHTDGKPCDWCGRPMYLDRRRNCDYDPQSSSPTSGTLQGDHSNMSRAEAIRRGVTIPLPDRLLHGECNRQRGDGANDHLAFASRGEVDGERLLMAWPT